MAMSVIGRRCGPGKHHFSSDFPGQTCECGERTYEPDIIQAAILELMKHQEQIRALLPCKVIIHLPPKGCNDPPPCLEIQAKLKSK